MTMKFLLHKDNDENGKASPQKQEFGCPSLQPSLRSHVQDFLPALWLQYNKTVKATTLSGAKNK
jgi:hypothetical protein